MVILILYVNCHKHGFSQNIQNKNFKDGYNSNKKLCGKIGHTIDVCYNKHSYPPSQKFYNKNAHIHNVAQDNKSQSKEQKNGENRNYMCLTMKQYLSLYGPSPIDR